MRALVYGWIGFEKINSELACSTNLPAYIMAILSHSSDRIERSCVMKIKDKPNFNLRLSRRFKTSAWVITSNPVVGSSAISKLGLQAKAIAITALCFIPPLNWCG